MALLPPALSDTLKRTAALRQSLELGTARLLRRRPALRLAIEGLPEQFATLHGAGLHAVYVHPSAARDALMLETARLSRAKFTTLALARTPEDGAALLRSKEFGARHPEKPWPSAINVLSLEGPPAANPYAANTVAPLTRVVSGLRALKRYGVKRNSLYVIEGADNWFSWHNPAALAQEGRFLASWCQLRQCSVLLVLDGRGRQDEDGNALFDEFGGQSEAVAAMHALHGAFGGVAHLLQAHGEMLWRIEFWRVNETLVTGETLPLRFTENGELAVAQGMIGGIGDSRFLTRDEGRVVVSQTSVNGEPWLPPHWEVVPSNADTIEACRDARGATVVLDYANQKGLADLCQTIHELRSRCGRALKIIVRERAEFMRHQYELLAISLGANLVVGRDVPFSRLQSLLESVQGQLNTRPIISDYQSALSAALSDSVCGYLSVPLFCEQVARVIERGKVLRLPHMLLQLQLRPEIAHIDVLQSCVLRRAGDICTADHEFVYLFLFACRVSDADNVLQRIFGSEVGRFFQREIRYIDEVDFVEQLRRLKNNDMSRAAPDFSDALSAERTANPLPVPAANDAAAAEGGPAAAADDNTPAAPAQDEPAPAAPSDEPVFKPRHEKWSRAHAFEMPIVKSARF
jgi:cellulose biosynthesis protein BcsE